MLLPCQTHCIIFIMSPRDMEFSLMRYRSLVKGAIRLPIVFSRLNVLLQGKKQAKVTYCVKLVILNSRCPEETHITNFTRMPLYTVSLEVDAIESKLSKNSFKTGQNTNSSKLKFQSLSF